MLLRNINIVNCTPHPIRWIGILGEDVTFEPSGNIARVGVEEEDVGSRYLLVRHNYTEVEGIPEPQENTLYIVSAMVLSASDRTDLIAPNTSKAFRDEQGRIYAVPNFVTK